jgi:hypothetical protein
MTVMRVVRAAGLLDPCGTQAAPEGRLQDGHVQ